MKNSVIAFCLIGVSVVAVVGCGTQSSNQSHTDTNQLSTSTSSQPTIPSSYFMPEGIVFANSEIGYVWGGFVSGNSRTGCVYRTTDGGHTWKEIFDQGTGVSVAVFGHHIWIDATNNQSSGLYVSKDEGQTFTKLNSLDLGVSDFMSQNVGWAMSVTASTPPNIKIMKTIDGGKHWSQVHAPTVELGGGASLSFANSQEGFLVETSQPGAGNQGKALLRTSNGGQTWNVISNVKIGERSKDSQLGSGGYVSGIDVVPSHPSSAYIWESRGPLLYTSDGGRSWKVSPMTKPDEIESRGVSMQTPNDGFIILQDMQHADYILEHTNNGGSSGETVYKWTYS